MPTAEFHNHGQLDLDVGVIYTYERHFMPPLLASLKSAAADVPTRLILIDNASADGTDEWTRYFRKTLVVRNAARLGYAENLNRVLQHSAARYVLLMNTDMFADPTEPCLAKMVRFMDRHPRCGLSICRLYHPDGGYGHPARRFPNVSAIAARRLGLGRLLHGARASHLYLEHDRHGTFPCDWVSGCFMFVRREAIEQSGPLDTGFRKYFEDVDLAVRMHRSGWQVLFNGDTFLYHWEQRASLRPWSKDARLHLRSYMRFLRKWGTQPVQPRRLCA